MEAVPKLPMLSFELKISPVCPDFAMPFKRFIIKYYGEDGDLYDREIMELESLRNNACRAPRDFTGCSLQKRYYAQIYSLYNRFVVFESNVGVQCIWADIYTGQTNIGDLDFELACILYNIGALHAELGATDSRQTADEMKVSCTHFQCAAWAFQHLMENAKLYRSNDLSNDVLSFFVQIMLAQAQECILEKSMLDNRKASIVAKVAAQVVEYYKSAIAMLQQGAMNTSSASSIIEVVGSKLFKDWKKFVEFKLTYYGAISHLYMGNVCEEQQKMGERVSWYESADSKMKEVVKLAKQLDSHLEVNESIVFVADVITVKLSNAKKENDFIYHEKVIPTETLADIKGASLVKGIPFSITDPEICGQDIFARLVPIEAHETASLYSAQKDEILRRIRRKIEEKNQDLISYLSSLQLDKDTLRTPKEGAIPDDLIDVCAELSLNPNAVDEVENTLTQLDSICEEADKAISESKQLLKEEEEKEKEHQELFGTRPPSLILVELSKELTKHEETHNKAVQSNRSLWENFDQHKDDVSIMTSSSASKIASILPSNKDINFNEETVKEMERLFDKVEEMKQQRQMLEDKLVKEMDTDNVLKLVLAHSKSEIESIFEREIKKYDQIVGLVEQNLAAQDNILRALTNCNAQYADTRKAVIEIQRNRKTRVASLMYTFQVFKELQTNSKKGLEFYDKFQGVITRLNARIRGVCKVQDEERVQFANARNKRMIPTSGISPMGVPAMMGTAAYIPSYSPGLTNLPAVSPSPPPIPASGAKLRDFLPYMNQNKSTSIAGTAGGSAIPVANYLTSTAGPIGPLSQNYPPPSMTPQSQFAPSAPIPSSTPLPMSVSPVSSQGVPMAAQVMPQMPQSYPQAGVQQQPPTPYNYLSVQANVPQPNPNQLNYSPPPSYSQAIASTVSYSLPAVISTISPTTSVTSSPIRPPAVSTQYQSYNQISQQPISSVLPIQHQLPNSPYGGTAVSSLSSSHMQPNYSTPVGPPSQIQNVPYGNQAYSNPEMSMTAPTVVHSTSNSYYYPSPVISSSNHATIMPVAPNVNQPTAMYQASVQPQAYLSSQGTAKPNTYQQPLTQPQNNNSMYQQYAQPASSQTAYYASNQAVPYVQQQAAIQQVPQPQMSNQQSYNLNSSVTPQQQQPQQQQPYFQVTNGTQYTQQAMIPNAVHNSVAATIQAIETESKGGWPVMMPTRMDQLSSNTTTPTVSNGTIVSQTTGQVLSGSDQLPDILATMSITNNTSQASTMVSASNQVDSSCKSLPSTIAPAAPMPTGATANGTANGNPVDSQTEQPKDLLSQFDPLFT